MINKRKFICKNFYRIFLIKLNWILLKYFMYASYHFTLITILHNFVQNSIKNNKVLLKYD